MFPGKSLGCPRITLLLEPSMAEFIGKITISHQPFKVGNEWRVKVIWPSGHPEEITGFKTQAEAKDWIEGDGAKAWLRKRGYADE